LGYPLHRNSIDKANIGRLAAALRVKKGAIEHDRITAIGLFSAALQPGGAFQRIAGVIKTLCHSLFSY